MSVVKLLDSGSVPKMDTMKMQLHPSELRSLPSKQTSQEEREGIVIASNIDFRVDEGRFFDHGSNAKIYHAQLRHQPVAAKYTTTVHTEAAFLQLCSHENVVKCHGIFDFNGLSYLAMDIAQVGDLRANLGYNRFSPTTMKLLVQQICRGLEHIHGQCILHRDLTVENLLLKSLTPLHVVIADFRHAQTFSEGAAEPNRHHVVRDSFYTSKSDIYLLAIVVIQIFQDGACSSSLSFRDRVLQTRQISNYSCVARGSRGLRTIINSLHDNPEVRPSAAEFAAAFVE